MNLDANLRISITLFIILTLFIIGSIVIYFKRKEDITWKPIIYGALVWILFSQILEKALHIAVFNYIPMIQKSPFIFAAYGALAAGIFEEVGRYVGYKTVLKKYRMWKDGVAYGLGHGSVEFLLISLSVVGQIYYVLSMMGKGQQIPPVAIESVREILSSPFSVFSLILFERISVLPIHIAFSILVLYSIRKKDIRYLGLAILLHALLDVPAVLYQVQLVPLIVPMILVALSGIAGVIYIIKSKKYLR